MEFNEIHTNVVIDSIDVDFYSDRSRTPSPTPVLSSNVCCDLEVHFGRTTLQGSIRVSRSQLINQELTIRPEANIECNVPEGLDLYNIIHEVDSDAERMAEAEAAAVQNDNTAVNQVKKN
ncbi:hypothetical protein ACJJTC_016756 [Scirpophaga incertulas]